MSVLELSLQSYTKNSYGVLFCRPHTSENNMEYLIQESIPTSLYFDPGLFAHKTETNITNDETKVVHTIK